MRGEATRRWRGWALLLGSVFSTLACSSSDEASPREQCLAFQDAYCRKAVECDVPSDRADQSEACDFFWQVYSGCDHVDRATGRLPLCMNALQSLSCASVRPGGFPEFPADCNDIFYTSP